MATLLEKWTAAADGTSPVPVYADFLAASPEERRQFLMGGGYSQYPAQNAALMLRNITVDGGFKQLSPEQYQQALASSGLDPAMQQAVGQNLQTLLANQETWRNDKSLYRNALLGAAAFGGVGLAGNALLAGGASAAGGATAAPAAAGESFLGPATGSVLEPGLQASGAIASPAAGGAAPVVSGVASGAGPFVPTAFGGVAGAGALSGLMAPSATAGGASAGGTAGAAAAGTAAAGTPLSRILEGKGTTADYASLAGGVLPAALGAYGASQQTSAMKDLADKYMAFGEPSRGRYEASFAPGFSMENEPGYKAALDDTTNSFLRKLSVQGNPFDNPGAWAETLKGVNAGFAYPALQNYRNQNAATGGFNAFNTAAPGVETGAIASQRGIYDAIGAGAADVLNPRPAPITLQDIYKASRGGLP